MSRSRCTWLIAPFAALLMGASSPSKPVLGDLPPYVQAYEPKTVDERGIWMEADEGERLVRDSALLIRDDALKGYIKGVLCKTVGEDRCKGVRIYVLEVPQFNASMSPNGTMRVWTGFLLRVQNEAELAAVLGHEFAHFELRHSLNGFKQARRASDFGAWLQVLGGIANTDTSNAQLAIVGTVFQFNREQEAAADILSANYLSKSQYPTIAAANVWKEVMAESDATAAGRGQKIQKQYRSGFFDTHPADAQRYSYLSDIATKYPGGSDFGAKEYREAIRRFLPRLLAAQVKSNDFGGSEFLLQQLSQQEGWTPELLFARGELFRQRANPRDLTTAAELFKEALAKGYDDPVVHRELGLSLLRNGLDEEGKKSLRQYLALKPDANDRSLIASMAGN